MAYQEGDTSPPHINVHNEVVTQVQDLADARNVDVILPPQRQIGDTEHVKDHNLITDALAAVAAAGGGKVLQVVRATLTSDQTTNSTSAVPVPGWTLTMTPTKPTSKIILMLSARVYTQRAAGGDKRAALSIVGENTSALDAQEFVLGDMDSRSTNLTFHTVTFMDYAEPTTTETKTLSVLYHTYDAATTVTVQGGTGIAQLHAYEIEEVVLSP